MSTMRPPLTTSMTTPLTTSSRFFSSSMLAHAFSYWARFFDRTRRPSLSSFWRTRHSTRSPSETISEGSTSLRMESSREGMTPSDLKPMSRRTSSWSILTTVPTTRSPSSNSRTLSPTSAVEVGADQVVFGDDARNVISVFVEGTHLLGGEEAGAVRHGVLLSFDHTGV